MNIEELTGKSEGQQIEASTGDLEKDASDNVNEDTSLAISEDYVAEEMQEKKTSIVDGVGLSEEDSEIAGMNSTVVATALVVTTMAMPVMAAEQRGSVNVDVSTKIGILRVAVPTKMSMEIDQFEITQQGSQIVSGVFDMHNYSEMDVSVVAESTATLKDGVSLVSSRTAAEDSIGDEAWLAVAAQTADGSYDDAATTDATEDYYDLSEANANVATFASDTKKAAQTFYLAKGIGNTAYNLAVPDAAEQVEKEVSQYYKLTKIATQPAGDADLQTAVDASDVYVVVATNAGKDGAGVTVIPKGDTVAGGANAWVGTNTYYTADAMTSTPPTGKTLATNFIKVNGVDASSWGSFGTSFAFDATNNTVTVKAVVFGFSSITGVTTNHKYTFTVKDSDGTEYSTAELDLAP